MQISSNQKVAYVAIPPDDEQWQKLGGDNTVTSTILNRFRQEVLSENENIETLIEKAIAEEEKYNFNINYKQRY